jgi:hypothetical protein
MIARSLESRFTNRYGEEFVVRVDPNRETGELLGDETDWEPLDIIEDRICGDFLLRVDEWESTAKAWRELTGRALSKPMYLLVAEMAAALNGMRESDSR